jgi:hypothetical protein
MSKYNAILEIYDTIAWGLDSRRLNEVEVFWLTCFFCLRLIVSFDTHYLVVSLKKDTSGGKRTGGAQFKDKTESQHSRKPYILGVDVADN